MGRRGEKTPSSFQACTIIAVGFLQRVRRRHAALAVTCLSLHQLGWALGACHGRSLWAGLAAIRRAHEADDRWDDGGGSPVVWSSEARSCQAAILEEVPSPSGASRKVVKDRRCHETLCSRQWKRVRAAARMPWSRVPRKGWTALHPVASSSCLAAEQSPAPVLVLGAEGEGPC